MSLVPLKAPAFCSSLANIVSNGTVDTKSTMNQVRRYSRAIRSLISFECIDFNHGFALEGPEKSGSRLGERVQGSQEPSSLASVWVFGLIRITMAGTKGVGTYGL